MSNTGQNTAELWERYRSQADPAAREQLALHYSPMVRYVVGRLGIPDTAAMDYQDLIGHGISGLLEAIDRFDPERGIAFETYAQQRIRGSILDALRGMDFVSRSVRRRSAEIERAIAELRNRTGQIPSDEEIAAHLDMDLDTYHDVLGQINIVFLSLDSPFSKISGDGQDEILLSEALEDPSMYDVMAEIEKRDLCQKLVDALQELPQREQLVLALYYYEELTIREVAEVMRLSPSRISQLLARAIMMLRAKLVYDVDLHDSRKRARKAAGSEHSRRAPNPTYAGPQLHSSAREPLCVPHKRAG